MEFITYPATVETLLFSSSGNQNACASPGIWNASSRLENPLPNLIIVASSLAMLSRRILLPLPGKCKGILGIGRVSQSFPAKHERVLRRREREQRLHAKHLASRGRPPRVQRSMFGLLLGVCSLGVKFVYINSDLRSRNVMRSK